MTSLSAIEPRCFFLQRPLDFFERNGSFPQHKTFSFRVLRGVHLSPLPVLCLFPSPGRSFQFGGLAVFYSTPSSFLFFFIYQLQSPASDDCRPFQPPPRGVLSFSLFSCYRPVWTLPSLPTLKACITTTSDSGCPVLTGWSPLLNRALSCLVFSSAVHHCFGSYLRRSLTPHSLRDCALSSPSAPIAVQACVLKRRRLFSRPLPFIRLPRVLGASATFSSFFQRKVLASFLSLHRVPPSSR